MLRRLIAAAIVAGIAVTLYFGHGSKPPKVAAPPLPAAPPSLSAPPTPHVVEPTPPAAPAVHAAGPTHRTHGPTTPQRHVESQAVTRSPSASPVAYVPAPARARPAHVH